MLEHDEVAVAVEEARRALAADPRLGQLDVDLAVRGDRIVVTGHVTTPERREIVSAVLAEHLAGMEIHNATTTIESLPEPDGPADAL